MEDVTGVFVAFLLAAGPLALLVTKAVDTVRNLVDAAGAMPKFVWNLAAFVFGVVLCLGWGYNLVSTLAHSIPALSQNTAFDGVWGQVLTGMAVGAMAGFWHEKLDEWSSTASAARAATPVNNQG